MNLTSTLKKIGGKSRLGKQICLWVSVAGLSCLVPNVLAQSDNFDAGNDSGWVRVNILEAYGGVNTYSFPDGPFGKAYRIQCTTSAVLAGNCGSCGTARSLVYRTNIYTDFYAAVDLVNWDNSLNQALAVLGRASGLTDVLSPCPLPACPPGFGTVNGYICNYDCNQAGAGATDVRGGEFQINRVDAESATTLASAGVSLIPGKSYRMILSGVGTLFTAQLYDLEDLSAPLVTIQATDSTYTSGPCGLIAFSRDATTADMTFDNYFAAASDPNTDIAPAIRHSVPGTPQVVKRTPVSRFTNLYSSASNITFTVQTFATSQINTSATKLFLNGADVSSSLAAAPGGGGVTYVTYPGLLTDNTVYAARIEVQDMSGTLKSTNTFWFDTFSNAYLTNAPVKTIEAEDYNYSNGVYQLEPIQVSGIDTNGLVVNGNGVGYYGLAGTAEVDFHTRPSRTSPEGGWNDYRADDLVDTPQGNREDIQDLNHPPPTSPAVDDPTRPNDNQRQAYVALGLKEYEVARSDANDWLNYTRVFADTNYYVYLRCGSVGNQDVALDLVGGNPTTTNQTTAPLGTFAVQNHLMRLNYRYEPLTIGGTPVIVHLAGTNTLRLTVGGTPSKDSALLSVNYLLFVPTSQGVTFFDNFNDGTDTTPPPAWMRYNPIQTGSWSFPGGNTYRIQSAPSPDPSTFGQGRAGSIKPGSYSDFYVAVDVVGWDDSIHQIFGVLARVNNPGPGTTSGYMFNYDRGNTNNPTGGDMDIVRLDNELPTDLDPSGSADTIHFETNKQYRIVFMGVGPTLTGQVYELPDTANPVVNYSVTDATYTSGSVGLVVANNASEIGYTGSADATFDNFLATTAEPRLTVTPSPGGLTLTWPQIGFILQTSPSLSSPVWTAVTSGITQAGSLNVYVVPAAGPAGYYRLATP
jgi:hypothetical protein